MPATVLQIGSLRTCSKCHESKSVVEFSPSPRVKSGLQRECKQCVSSRATAWWRNNTSKYNDGRRVRRYNIDVNVLWEQQNGLCAIYHELMLPKGKKARSVVVDHDQRCCSSRGTCCGKCVRGLVHSRCNIVLGVLEKERKTLGLAKEYLRRYEEKGASLGH
jgi:hypothetical protein